MSTVIRPVGQFFRRRSLRSRRFRSFHGQRDRIEVLLWRLEIVERGKIVLKCNYKRFQFYIKVNYRVPCIQALRLCLQSIPRQSSGLARLATALQSNLRRFSVYQESTLKLLFGYRLKRCRVGDPARLA